MRSNSCLGLLALCLTFYSGSDAQARESAHRAQLTQKSLQSGLGVGEVSLLNRLPGPGSEAVVQRLSEGFARQQELTGTFAMEQDGAKLHAVGPNGVRFRIDDDGTAIRYRNRALTDHGSYKRVAVKDRMSHEKLVELGLSLIRGSLADFVNLSADDALVPLKSDYEIEGGISESGVKHEEKVVSGTIVFGRTIAGIDVVGPGSKVAITFGNDGSVLAFHVDWPQYEKVGRTQRVLARNALFERVSALSTMRFGSDEVQVKRFECGYFDAGASKTRDRMAVIQAGCMVHYTGLKKVNHDGKSESIMTAIVDPVPVGATVEPDAGWPHATALLKTGDVCAISELSSAVSAPATP